MLTRHVTSLLVVLIVLVSGTTRAAEPDPEAARSLAALARSGLESHHPDEAAALFERAFDADPHPLWQVAAGTCWLDALEPERAAERLAAALASPTLTGSARAQAESSLGVARRLAPIVARARRSSAEADHAPAMRAWEEAFRIHPVGRALVLAASAADRAERPAAHLRLLAAAEARADLSAEDRRAVADARSRLARMPPVAPEDTRSTAPWWLVAAGGAVVIAGVVALGVSEGRYAELAAIERSAVDGVVFDTSRADATDARDRARRWSTIGWVGVGAGLATVAFGAGWLVGRDPVGRSAVQIQALVIDGIGVGAAGSF